MNCSATQTAVLVISGPPAVLPFSLPSSNVCGYCSGRIGLSCVSCFLCPYRFLATCLHSTREFMLLRLTKSWAVGPWSSTSRCAACSGRATSTFSTRCGCLGGRASEEVCVLILQTVAACAKGSYEELCLLSILAMWRNRLQRKMADEDIKLGD